MKNDKKHVSCKFCNKPFSPNSIKHHILSVHQKVVIECGYCLRSFARKSYLINHSKRLHVGKQPLILSLAAGQKCPHCYTNLPFASASRYRAHISICGANPYAKERPKYQCSVCEFKFTRMWNKKIHEKRRHGLDVATSTDKNSDEKLNKNVIDGILNNSLDPELLISRSQSTKKYSNRFKVDETSTTFHFTDLANRACREGYIIPTVSTAFQHILSESERKPNKIISVSLDSDSLDWPHCTPLQKSTEFDTSLYLDKLSAILNSNQSIDLGDDMRLETRSIELPSAAGAKVTQKSVASMSEFLRRNQGTIDPNWLHRNVHLNSCFVVSLAMKIHTHNNRSTRHMYWYINHRYPQSMADTVEFIYDELGIESDSPITPLLYDQLDKILSRNYNIQLICYHSQPDLSVDLVYIGSHSGDIRAYILVEVDRNHCRLIVNIRSLFKGKFCNTCLKIGNSCACYCQRKPCKKCGTVVCTRLITNDNDSGFYQCNQCFIAFDSKLCYDLHKNHTCHEIQKCLTCFQNVKRSTIDDGFHEAYCGKRKCHHCQCIVDFHDDEYSGHICFIKRPSNKKALQPNLRIIYLDLESIFDSQGYHQCILAVALRTCRQCCLDYEAENTECCGTRQHVFGGTSCLKSLVTWLFFNPKHKGAKVMAQAGSFYDALILFRGLIQMGHTAKLAVRGNRILTMTAGVSVTVVDAYCFFGVSLAKLAPMFGLQLQKSFFPMSFLKTNQINYKGIVPPRQTFEPEKMTEKRRNDFGIFYEQLQNQEVYCFKSELLKYCILDTKVLYIACTKFQQLMVDGTGVNPFAISTSIASLCVFLYKLCFMPVNDNGQSRISLLPEHDLRARGLSVQSDMALKWIAWMRYSMQLPVESALTGREPIIGNRSVDGLCIESLEELPQIFQFHGCFVHGHSPSCPNVPEQWFGRKHPFFPNLTFNEVHERTLVMDEQLRNHGNLTVLYQCELEQQLKSNQQMQDFFQTYDTTIKKPLSPRFALYGGRVECAISLIELTSELIDNGYKIGYLDFTSLYPSVMYQSQYPVGKPKIYKATDLPNFGRFVNPVDIKKFYGLIYLKTTPPRTALHFPVLPRRAKDGTLIFALCRTCSEERIVNKECHHTDEERSWEAVYTTIEYAQAIDRGYETPQIFEVWHFDEKMPANDGERGLFEDYVRHFLRIKIVSSPIPHEYINDKQSFCQEINDRYGFDVKPDELKPNTALRSLAKLMLNNLWGKFGQNPETAATEVHIVKSSAQLSKLVANPKQQLTNCRLVTDDVLLVQTKKDVELIDVVHSTSNVVISSWTTALARLKLLEAIEPIEFSVAYLDTDSMIFLYKDNFPMETSDHLGCLKNELADNDFITKLVVLGNKSYCYHTHLGKTEIKFKGLTQIGKDELCFDKMKQLLLAAVHQLPNQPMHLTIRDSKIRRSILEGGTLKNIPDAVKKVQYSMTKRQIVYCDFDLFNYRLFPWGWCVGGSD